MPASSLWYLPAGQSLQLVFLPWLWYLPPSQELHWCASDVAAYIPGLHESQRLLPTVPWLLPAWHEEHWIAPPSAYLPRAQLTQAVAELLLLALPAAHDVQAHAIFSVLRNLPAAHAASVMGHVEHSCAPIAEKKPKAHGVHTAADFAPMTPEALPSSQ